MADGQGSKGKALKIVLLLLLIAVAIILVVTRGRRGEVNMLANPAQGEIDQLEEKLIKESATLSSEEKEQLIDQIKKLEELAP